MIPGERVGSVIELTVHALTAAGTAVGRHESGLTVFVPYALPGEHVRVRIHRDKGRYAFADLLELLTTAPSRTTPPCPHFGQGRCGGCDWQHIHYSDQLRFKRQIIEEQLHHIGRLHDVYVEDVHPCPAPFHYRLHATFVHDHDRIGFVSTDDRSPYWIDTCHIIDPQLNAIAADPAACQALPSKRRIRLITDGHRTVAHEQPAEFTPGSRRSDPRQCVFPRILGVPFRVSPGSFFQTNRYQTESLVTYVLDLLQLTPRDDVIDVYCGVGLFTLFTAQTAHTVIGVEQSPSAVRDARYNTRNLERVEIIAGDAAHVLPTIKHKASVTIVDPPRSGLSPAALKAIALRRPDRWLYVSCDPTTFARDARLIVDSGYRLQRVKPIDMFPQTHHIEIVSLFVRAER